MRTLAGVGAVAVATVAGAFGALVVAARRRRPEQTWNPGLEFDPDFDLTDDEIRADLRGEAPSA